MPNPQQKFRTQDEQSRVGLDGRRTGEVTDHAHGSLLREGNGGRDFA